MTMTKKIDLGFKTNKRKNGYNTRKKRANITTFKTKKNTQGKDNNLLTKRIRTKKIQKGKGILFISNKKKKLLSKYEEYLKIIENYYFKELDDAIKQKDFNKQYKYSYQKSFLKKLNTKYRTLMRKCIYKILIILYKQDKYRKSANIITSSNKKEVGKGYSLYKILKDNTSNIVTNFFTTLFEDKIKIHLDNMNDDTIKEYINKKPKTIHLHNKELYNINNNLYIFESISALDRHFNHSNKIYIVLSVKNNDIYIINNIFTQIKFYINYLKNNTGANSKKEKDVKKVKNMLKEHFKYLCNNKIKIANFFVQYIKYTLKL